MRWLLIGWLLFVLVDSFAQENTQICRNIKGSIILKNSQIIVPETIHSNQIEASKIKISELSYNIYKVVLDTLLIDSVEVCYNVLPLVFSTNFKSDTTRYYDSAALFSELVDSKPNQFTDKRQELFDMGDLNRSGQISRGISAGNTQNLTVNSSLNLNLEGQLTEDLRIKAHISDQDIPYQPEGNTQQLQDFDKVYIQFYNDNFSVVGGDVVLENENTYFLKYKKNVLGGIANYSSSKSNSSIGASSAKGQFAAVALSIQEGIYGPYKIPPPDNVGFVIIIANSEKVYLDGKQLIRGYENDYIIDYNQAEVEFTSNVLITKYSRITVDYEYAVRSYGRSIITSSHSQQLGNTKLGVHLYQEKDNRNKSLYRTLSDADKLILSQAGDSLELAVVKGDVVTEFMEDRILYIKKDTIVNGVVETIFLHTNANLPELYSVQFTDIGVGKGNYQIAEYVSEGRVYEWVGNNNGSYAPYVLLTAPNEKQMVSVSGNTKLGAFTNVFFEAAFSKLDKNLFSDINDDNNGQAVKVGANLIKLPLGDSDYTLSSSVETVFLSKNFSIIDRFRRVEFDRDWGIAGQGNMLGEQDVNLSAFLGFEKDGLNNFSYRANYRTKENTIEGFQHQLGGAKTLAFLQLKVDALLMDGILPTAISSWRKFNGEAFIKGKIQPGYRYIIEQNTAKDMASDSIISSKNYFEDHQFFIRSNLTPSTKFEILYSIRNDQIPQNGELKTATEAETITGKFTTQINSNHAIKVVVNYRDLGNTLLATTNVQSISGRVDWVGDLIPKAIRNELSYNIANARVPKREYVFIEVPTGEGTHTWRDDNGDGVKGLEEFFEAFNNDEKRYIKLYVPSNEFVDAFENRFNYRLSVGFPVSWKKEKGFKKMMSRFSNSTSWTTQYSTTENDLAARLIPFIADIDTSKLLSARESFRSTLFLNKNNPTFGVNMSYLSRTRKILYANGFEGRSDMEYSFTMRWNIKRQYQFSIKGLLANRSSDSDYLKGRNYSLEETKLGPIIAWQPKPTFRVTTTYNYGVGQQIHVPESASVNYSLLNEIASELRLGTVTKFVFNAQAKYTNIGFVGAEQSAIGYELLKGLRPGNNFALLLSWQQRLVNGLQVQLFYEGRKPEGVAIIHSMRVGVNALF